MIDEIKYGLIINNNTSEWKFEQYIWHGNLFGKSTGVSYESMKVGTYFLNVALSF